MGQRIKDNLVTDYGSSCLPKHELMDSDAIVQAFNNAAIGIFYLGFKFEIRCFNQRILDILDIELDGEIPSYKDILVYSKTSFKNTKDLERLFTLHIKEYYKPQELILETKDNKVLYCSSQAIVNDGMIDGVVWSVSDITEHKTQERIATYRSLHDPLTQLPNRTYLFDKLQKLTSKKPHKKFALLFLDFDDFKHINDQFGHMVGDQFLIHCVSRISNSLRVPDTLVRLSGDEFIVLLANIDSKELVEKIIKRIYLGLADGVNLHDTQLLTSVSIGVSFFPKNTDNARELIRQADKAMYKAKHNGKNTFCFYQSSMES